ncbi:MAG: class I SAM-dependent methyltransferase [Anaerolineaceae bacterium]
MLETTTIKELHLGHEGKISDKWFFYLNEWDRLFKSYKDTPIDLLEIGIQNGGSLEIWAKYFTKANHIIGCDIDEHCGNLTFIDKRIHFVFGDALKDETQKKVLENSLTYDIIIDDGSHDSIDVIKAFSRYFPVLKEGGLYIIEDFHTSFWDQFHGGIYSRIGASAFVKRLTDILNFEHWKKPMTRKNYLADFESAYGIEFSDVELARMHSIELLNSMVVITKRNPTENVLGPRIISGKEEIVTIGMHAYSGTAISDISSVLTDSSEDLKPERIAAVEVALSLSRDEFASKMQSLSESLKQSQDDIELLIRQKETLEEKQPSLVSEIENLKFLKCQSEEEMKVIDNFLTSITSGDLASHEQSQEYLAGHIAFAEEHTELMPHLFEIATRLLNLESQIAKQTELQVGVEKELAQSRLEASGLSSQLANAKKEIAGYALSNSWKLTKPLRKFAALFRRN